MTFDDTYSLKDKESLQNARLWIANNIIERRFSRQSESCKSSRNIVIPWLNVQNSKLDIVERVPSSSSEPGEFFYNLCCLVEKKDLVLTGIEESLEKSHVELSKRKISNERELVGPPRKRSFLFLGKNLEERMATDVVVINEKVGDNVEAHTGKAIEKIADEEIDDKGTENERVTYEDVADEESAEESQQREEESSSSEEEIADDEPIAKSFRSFKPWISEDLKCARDRFRKGESISERMAAVLVSKNMFLSCLWQEYAFLQNHYGKKNLLAYMRYVNNMFSFYRKDSKFFFDSGGYSFEHFTDTLSLTTGNLLMHVILPELLTYYEMINNDCTYKDAVKYVYNKQNWRSTVFHIPLLTKVGSFKNFDST